MYHKYLIFFAFTSIKNFIVFLVKIWWCSLVGEFLSSMSDSLLLIPSTRKKVDLSQRSLNLFNFLIVNISELSIKWLKILFIYLLFWRVFLCSPDWPGIHCVEPGYSLRQTMILCFPTAGIKGMHHYTGLNYLNWFLRFYSFLFCIYKYFAYMCVCASCVCAVPKDQKSLLDPL